MTGAPPDRSNPSTHRAVLETIDPLEDAVAYGRDLIPLVRDLVAAREANPVRVAS